MSFQINALPESLFSEFFTLSDAQLAQRSSRRMVVDAKPGFPCRVSLADAEIGETVILLNYEHQANDTPYRASHAIFVRKGAKQSVPEPGVVPEFLKIRLLSVRAFDSSHHMIAADVVDGQHLETAINELFSDPNVEYLHLHNAKPGCYNASVVRA